jgi:hypothetical protein
MTIDYLSSAHRTLYHSVNCSMLHIYLTRNLTASPYNLPGAWAETRPQLKTWHVIVYLPSQGYSTLLGAWYMGMEQWWHDDWRGKPSVEKNLPQCHFISTKNLKCSHPGLNLGFHSKKTVPSFSQIKIWMQIFHIVSVFQLPSRGLLLSILKFQHELQNNCSLCTHTISTSGCNYLENPILTIIFWVMTPCSVVCW